MSFATTGKSEVSPDVSTWRNETGTSCNSLHAMHVLNVQCICAWEDKSWAPPHIRLHPVPHLQSPNTTARHVMLHLHRAHFEKHIFWLDILHRKAVSKGGKRFPRASGCVPQLRGFLSFLGLQAPTKPTPPHIGPHSTLECPPTPFLSSLAGLGPGTPMAIILISKQLANHPAPLCPQGAPATLWHQHLRHHPPHG